MSFQTASIPSSPEPAGKVLVVIPVTQVLEPVVGQVPEVFTAPNVSSTATMLDADGINTLNKFLKDPGANTVKYV